MEDSPLRCQASAEVGGERVQVADNVMGVRPAASAWRVPPLAATMRFSGRTCRASHSAGCAMTPLAKMMNVHFQLLYAALKHCVVLSLSVSLLSGPYHSPAG
jgi:hypothetical protein